MSMAPGPHAQQIKAQLTVWWILWAGVLVGLLAIYFVAGRNATSLAPPNLKTNLAGFVPLFISVVVRWLVLPRCAAPKPALVMFVLGLSLGESCGLLGIFLGGPYRQELFVLGVLGIAQFAPFYARKYYEPEGSGFIPNN